jgi:hypothetical protein
MSSVQCVRIASSTGRDGQECYSLTSSRTRKAVERTPSNIKDSEGDTAQSKHDVNPRAKEFRVLCAIDLCLTPKFALPRIPDNILRSRLAEAMHTNLPDITQLLAAQRIAVFVRPRLVRQHRVPHTLASTSHLVSAHFATCLRETLGPQQPQIGSRRDRLLVLGPLPHALATLDILQLHFTFRKDVLSRRLQKVGPMDLEDAGEAVARVQYVHTLLTPHFWA